MPDSAQDPYGGDEAQGPPRVGAALAEGQAPEGPFAFRYISVFGIVTNMDWEGGKLIRWLHERCGKSEEAHSVMKEDLAGGDDAQRGFWGKRSLVVDHDFVPEPERGDEKFGIR